MNRFMQRCWKVAAASFGRSRHVRHLALLETLSLGERRFLAIVRCGGERFLLGATGNSIALLTRLDAESEFEMER
jgi:flagellar biogenesis protein FliO